jgi:hypothetical protein
MSEKVKRYGQVIYSPCYPYQGPNGEPAAAIHFCGCEYDCGSSACSSFNVERTTPPIMVTNQGTPKPRRITDTNEWTLDRLKKLVDLVSCHVTETPNYLSTSTQISLIQQALNDE